MAGALFALLDDLGMLLKGAAANTDGVAASVKIATAKTAAVVTDDLAVATNSVNGIRPHREIPVIARIGVNSLKNKRVQIVVLLALGAAAPWAVIPLLMAGGKYLEYEAFEKILHTLKSRRAHGAADNKHVISAPDHAAFEKEAIGDMTKTDFVLSGEINILTLGSVAARPFATQVATLGVTAAVMTVGVYGVVAALAKIDDLARKMVYRKDGSLREDGLSRRTGEKILKYAPALFEKILPAVGTAAMLLVGGGITLEHIPAAAPLLHYAEHAGAFLGPVATGGLKMVAGLLGGAAAFGAVKAAEHLQLVPRAKKLAAQAGTWLSAHEKTSPALARTLRLARKAGSGVATGFRTFSALVKRADDFTERHALRALKQALRALKAGWSGLRTVLRLPKKTEEAEVLVSPVAPPASPALPDRDLKAEHAAALAPKTPAPEPRPGGPVHSRKL